MLSYAQTVSHRTSTPAGRVLLRALLPLLLSLRLLP